MGCLILSLTASLVMWSLYKLPSRFLKHLISVACNLLEIATVVLLMSDGVDLSPYRIAYHVDFENTPAWFEQRRTRTGTSRSQTSNILSERLAERVWYPKSQSSLLNIYFLISGFSSSLLLIYPLRGLSQTVEPKPFRYATIQFQDRRGVASLLYRNQACRNRRSYMWTNALSDVLFVPARELWSSRMHLFYSPGANYEVEFGLFMLFLRRMLSVFLVSSCSQSPYTLLAFRAHSQITVPALAFTNQGSLSREKDPGGGRGVLPNNRLMEMCGWMGSHFPDWVDYNGVVIFNRVTRMGSLIFGGLRVRKFRLVGI